MRFRFIEQHARTYPVRLMCRVLQVSPSGYYAWRSRPESRRALANRGLLQEVHRLHGQHHGRYGSPRMHAALQGRRPPGQPRPGRAADAPAWHSRSGSSALPADNDRQSSSAADCAQPAPAEVHGICDPTACGWPTSPTFPRARDGCISPRCWIWRPGRWWAGPCATTCARS